MRPLRGLTQCFTTSRTTVASNSLVCVELFSERLWCRVVWLKFTWLVFDEMDASSNCPRFKASVLDRARNRRTRFQPPGVVLRAVHMVHACRFVGDRGSHSSSSSAPAVCTLDSLSNSNRRLGMQHADRQEFFLNTFFHRVYGLTSDIDSFAAA